MPQIINHNPAMPPELAATIARHLKMFEGFSMMAEQPSPTPAAEGEQRVAGDSVGGKGADQFASEHSKNSVLADLAAERDRRQQLQAEVDRLKPLQKLVDALAPEAVEGEDDTQAAIKAINDRLAAAEHRALVAEQGEGLTTEDKAILSQISDPEVLSRVAARLRRDASASESGPTRHIPKPDRSTGSGGGEKPSSSVAAGRDLYRSRHPQKN